MLRPLLGLIACFASCTLAFTKPPSSDNDRLLATAKLWVTVRYFHPYLAYRDIDWDKALVDALPKIRGAQSSAEYLTAIEYLLDALHDPASFAVLDNPQQFAPSLDLEKRPDGTLVVSQSSASGQNPNAIEQLKTALHSAAKIVFDLRIPPGAPDYLSHLLDESALANALSRQPIDSPAQRTWVHNGLAPAVHGMYFSGYHSAFYTKAGEHIEGDPSSLDPKVVFILNENSPLPLIGSALFANGKAVVLADDEHFQISGVDTVVIPMGEGVQAIVRLSEPVSSPEVRIAPKAAALDRAIEAVSMPLPVARAKSLPAAPSPEPDRAYAENRYPSTEYRILAAYKIWGVFRYFFAYRDLMDEDWDELFASRLPKFIDAKDAREYNLTVAEMVAHTADSHTVVRSEELSEYFGKAPVGLRLRLIEKKPVITEILDDEAKNAGIQVGDIVSKVDGENMVDRFNRESPYLASSTPQSHGYRLIQRILNGPEGSMANLVIGGQDGRTREIALKRESKYSAALAVQRTGEVFKLLPGNIGYADLDRLTPDQVDPMFDKFRSAKAIIFDMRGYPHGTAWYIAPRLTDKSDVPAALFTGPLSLTPDLPNGETLTGSASYLFIQKIPANDKWKYKGKTVMLIDERAASQAEHTGLFLEAANGTEFIGTPTAGVDGDVSNFVVPGGITINFSGHDIRHANGGKLQRLGLLPAITVAPTIDGIRKGRDEVLEKSIEYLSTP